MSTSTIEVVGMAEAAELVGVTKSNFSAHRTKYNGEGECPAPTETLTCGPVWVGSDVKALRKWGERFSKIRVTRAPAGSSKAKVAKAAKATKAGPPAKPRNGKAVVEAPAEAPPAPAKAASSSKKAAAAAGAPKKGLFKK